MEDESIQDNQITASREQHNGVGARHGRLNRIEDVDGSEGGWYPGVDDINQWIQVDLLVSQRVVGVMTQGPDVKIETGLSPNTKFSTAMMLVYCRLSRLKTKMTW